MIRLSYMRVCSQTLCRYNKNMYVPGSPLRMIVSQRQEESSFITITGLVVTQDNTTCSIINTVRKPIHTTKYAKGYCSPLSSTSKAVSIFSVTSGSKCKNPAYFENYHFNTLWGTNSSDGGNYGMPMNLMCI